MGPNGWMARKTATWCQSWYMSNTAIQYVCAGCGIVSGILFILAFIIAHFVPPTHPWWDAEQIAHFYQEHTTRIRTGASILMIAGGFYLPFSTAISYQIRRIPNIPSIIYHVQLASAAAGIWTYTLPGIVLAIASFRPERPSEVTYALNDFFWLVVLMPWPTFMVQNFAFAFAILYDNRKKPLFPKELAIVNIIVPILLTTTTGIHSQTKGPFSYNGVLGFYIPGFSFTVQQIIDGIFLVRAACNEEKEGKLDDCENNVVENLALSKHD